MPSSFDLARLKITNDPNQRIDMAPGKFKIPPFDPTGLIDSLIDQLDEATGLDLSGLKAVVDAISAVIDAIETGNWAELGPLLSNLFTTDWFGDLLGLLGNPSGLGTGTTTLPDLSSIPLLGPLIAALLNGGQGVNVLNLFGQIGPELLGFIHPSAIGGGDSPDLLDNGPFTGEISVDGAGIWEWDDTDGHTSNGCVKTTADGTLKALRANSVPVSAGQKVDLSVWTKSVGYTGSGTPIRLTVAKYKRDEVTRTEPQVGSPTTVTSVAGSNASWTHITGQYTVPADGTVNRLRMRLVVDTTATGGTVKFDDATLTKPGNGPFDGILDLFGLSSLDDLFSGLNVAAIWTAIVNDIINPLGMLFGVGDLIPDSNVPGVTNILDELWGAITGLFTAGRSHSDMTGAVQGQTDAVTNHAAVLSQVVAALSTGTPDADAFERTDATNLQSAWDQYQTGSGAKLATPNGHDAAFSINLLTAGEWVARRNAVFALGDNQVTELVFATIPATFGANGHNDLWLRMTNFSTFATRTGLCLRYSGDGSLHLYWFASGTPTTLFSGTASLKATAGATLRFEAGVGVAPRRFKAFMNGTPLMDTTEVGTTSQFGVGSGYKYRGFGGKSESVLVNFLPGSLRQWTASG